MSLAEQSLKFCNPCLVLILISIASKRFFGILGQLFSPPSGQARMDVMLAGDLSKRFATLKFGYYGYLECSVVAPPRLFHILPTMS